MNILRTLIRLQSSVRRLAGTLSVLESKPTSQDFHVHLDPIEVGPTEEAARKAQIESDRQHSDQRFIGRAAWASFMAVVVYAIVTLLMWNAMRKQNKIADSALAQSRVDERAWVEIDSIKPILLRPADQQFSATFMCNLFPKNVGKTVARDIDMRAMEIFTTDGWDANADQVRKAQDRMFTGQGSQFGQSAIPKVLAPNSVSPVPFRLTCQAPKA